MAARPMSVARPSECQHQLGRVATRDPVRGESDDDRGSSQARAGHALLGEPDGARHGGDPGVLRARCSAGSSGRDRSTSAPTCGPCSTATRSPGSGRCRPTATCRSPGPPTSPRTTRTPTAEQIRHCGGTVGVGPAGRRGGGPDGHRVGPGGRGLRHLAGGRAPGDRRSTGVPGAPAWNELVTQETRASPSSTRRSSATRRRPVVSADFDYLTLRSERAARWPVHGVGQALPARPGRALDDVLRGGRHRRGGAAWSSELGGHVLKPARDGSQGRLATVADPEGAVFTLVRSAPREEDEQALRASWRRSAAAQAERPAALRGTAAAARAVALVIRLRWWRRHSTS